MLRDSNIHRLDVYLQTENGYHMAVDIKCHKLYCHTFKSLCFLWDYYHECKSRLWTCLFRCSSHQVVTLIQLLFGHQWNRVQRLQQWLNSYSQTVSRSVHSNQLITRAGLSPCLRLIALLSFLDRTPRVQWHMVALCYCNILSSPLSSNRRLFIALYSMSFYTLLPVRIRFDVWVLVTLSDLPLPS